MRASQTRYGLTYCVSLFGLLVGVIALFSVEAGAALVTLIPGHAYCYYFSGAGRSGGMHLVAASPTVIAGGPSNYVSGTAGAAQKTVFYIDCTTGLGRVGGEAYVGVPRITATQHGGRYTFDQHYVRRGIRHLETHSRATSVVSVTISGVIGAGVINGTVRISAPGCLAHPTAVNFVGT